MAQTNMHTFEMGLKRFQGRAETRRRQITQATMMTGLRSLIETTRVDTGRARGNWQVAEGRPPTGEIDRLDPTGEIVMTAEGRKVTTASGTDIIWAHNGVPYIGGLEDMDKMLFGTAHMLRAWIRTIP